MKQNPLKQQHLHERQWTISFAPVIVVQPGQTRICRKQNSVKRDPIG
jgi:hypothetical protein